MVRVFRRSLSFPFTNSVKGTSPLPFTSLNSPTSTTRSPNSNPGPPSTKEKLTVAQPHGSSTVSSSLETSKKRSPTYFISHNLKNLSETVPFSSRIFLMTFSGLSTPTGSSAHLSSPSASTSYIKSRRSLARDIAKLTPGTKYQHCHVDTVNGTYGDAELVSVIGDVIPSHFPTVSTYLSARPFIGFLKMSEKKDRLDEGIEELKQVEEKSLVGLSKKKHEEDDGT